MPSLFETERGYRLRGRLSTWRVVAIHHWPRILGIIIGISAIIVEVLTRSELGLIGILGGALALVQLAFIVRDALDVDQEGKRYFFGGPRDPSVLDTAQLSDLYLDFERLITPNGSAIRSTALDLSLWSGLDRRIELMSTPWRIPPLAERFLQFTLRQRQRSTNVLYNSAKVALRSDISAAGLRNDTEPIRVQATDYFAGEVTNELTGLRIIERETRSVVYDGRSMAVSDEVLSDLAESTLSNHIGVSTLGITSDGFLVLPLQSPGSAQSATTLAPTGSGSIDLEDAVPAGSLHEMLVTAMDRELSEECGVPRDVLTTRVCGFARLLHRGGKPDFFGLTRMAVPLDRVQVAFAERPFISTHMSTRVDRSSPAALRRSLAPLVEGRRHELSFLLKVGLRVLDDLLAERPDEVLAFFTGPETTGRTPAPRSAPDAEPRDR